MAGGRGLGAESRERFRGRGMGRATVRGSLKPCLGGLRGATYLDPRPSRPPWCHAPATDESGATPKPGSIGTAPRAPSRPSSPTSGTTLRRQVGRSIPLGGHYAGLIRVGRETIAITTDTVGTKSLLAEALGRWVEIGVDAVAVNVNDLASVGARPAGLVDVISCRQADPDVFADIGRGIDQGLRAARCSLLGGETAIVPELLQGVDVGGTAIGFFPAGRNPVTGARIRPGDVLLGIPSSGLHANGLTLARRIVAESKHGLRAPRPGATKPIGVELLTASRIYVAASEALADLQGTTGFAHISGGGVRNLTRLHRRVQFVLDGWPPARDYFRWLAEVGGSRPRRCTRRSTWESDSSRSSVPPPRARRSGPCDARAIPLRESSGMSRGEPASRSPNSASRTEVTRKPPRTGPSSPIVLDFTRLRRPMTEGHVSSGPSAVMALTSAFLWATYFFFVLANDTGHRPVGARDLPVSHRRPHVRRPGRRTGATAASCFSCSARGRHGSESASSP